VPTQAFENAEKMLVNIFATGNGGTSRSASSEQSSSHHDSVKKARRDSTIAVLSAQGGDDAPSMIIDIQQLTDLLEKRQINISDAALQRLFNKIDTSGDQVTSAREIANFVEDWEPTDSEARMLAITGTLFRPTGLCMTGMLFAKIAIFGNGFLWKDQFSADDKHTITVAALHLIGLGVIGFILMLRDSIGAELELRQNTRQTLINAATHESNWEEEGQQELTEDAARSGVSIRELFRLLRTNDSSAWVQRVLSTDGCLAKHDIKVWCETISNSPHLNHIKYFSALLRRDVPLACEMTGMPAVVVYRLCEALETDAENPWQMTSLTLKQLSKLLEHNNIMIATHLLEDVFNEIDVTNAGRITHDQFSSWIASYRPLGEFEKQQQVRHTLLMSMGFWKLVCPLVGVILLLGPGYLWAEGGLHPSFPASSSAQLAFILIFVGAAENVRQAWRAEMMQFDQFEHDQLDFKASIESATDKLEMVAHMAANAAVIATAAAAAAAAAELRAVTADHFPSQMPVRLPALSAGKA
jgi:Ca2+-binding EF-hand superfamily protein